MYEVVFSLVVKLIIAELIVILDISILDIIGAVSSSVIVSITGLSYAVQFPTLSLNQA